MRTFAILLATLLFFAPGNSRSCSSSNQKSYLDSLIANGAFLQARSQTVDHFKIELEVDSFSCALSMLSIFGRACYEKGQTQFAVTAFDKALQILRQSGKRFTTEKDLNKLLWFHVHKGFYEKSLSRILEARASYHSAEEIAKKLELGGLNIYRFIYLPLGNIYTRLGDYGRAEYYLKAALQACLDQGAGSFAAGIFSDLGILHQDSRAWGKAKDSYRSAIQLDGVAPDYLAIAYLNLARVHQSNGELDLALQIADTAQTFLTRARRDPSSRLNIQEKQIMLDLLRAEIQSALGHFLIADTLYKTVRDSLHILYFQDTARREFAKYYIARAHHSKNKDQFKEALLDFYSAIRCVLPKPIGDSSEKHLASGPAIWENSLVEGLEGMLDAYMAIYDRTGDSQFLGLALECYEGIVLVEDRFRAGFNYRSSKFTFAEELHGRSEKALELLFIMCEKQRIHGAVEAAFKIIERSKSALLLEQSLKSGLRLGEVGQDSLKRRIDLRLKELGSELACLNPSDSVDKRIIREEIFDLRLKRDSLLDRESSLRESMTPFLERSGFSDLKQTLALAQDAACGILNYFEGKNACYLLSIFPDAIFFDRIPIGPDYSPKRLRFLNLLTKNLSIQETGYGKKAVQDYRNKASTLYNCYFPKRVDSIIEGVNHLIIIPDGKIHGVPFGALVRDTSKGPCTDYSQLGYLIKDIDIQYAYGAGFLNLRVLRDAYSRDFKCLGLAPFAIEGPSNTDSGNPRFSWGPGLNGLRNNLSPLVWSDPELRAISEQIGGVFLRGSLADEAHLKKLIEGDFEILHMATHAYRGGHSSEPALVLAWDSDPDEDGLLDLNEIINMKIQSKLAVLSACETGLGKDRKGEGILSLAWAFRYAGCPNMVISLWGVDDESTSKIFQDFYRELETGKSYSSALQSSKLMVIEQRNMHPALWAGITFKGDFVVVAQKSWLSSFWLVVLLGLLALVYEVLLTFAIKGRNRNEKSRA